MLPYCLFFSVLVFYSGSLRTILKIKANSTVALQLCVIGFSFVFIFALDIYGLVMEISCFLAVLLFLISLSLCLLSSVICLCLFSLRCSYCRRPCLYDPCCCFLRCRCRRCVLFACSLFIVVVVVVVRFIRFIIGVWIAVKIHSIALLGGNLRLRTPRGKEYVKQKRKEMGLGVGRRPQMKGDLWEEGERW